MVEIILNLVDNPLFIPRYRRRNTLPGVHGHRLHQPNPRRLTQPSSLDWPLFPRSHPQTTTQGYRITSSRAETCKGQHHVMLRKRGWTGTLPGVPLHTVPQAQLLRPSTATKDQKAHRTQPIHTINFLKMSHHIPRPTMRAPRQIHSTPCWTPKVDPRTMAVRAPPGYRRCQCIESRSKFLRCILRTTKYTLNCSRLWIECSSATTSSRPTGT